VGPEADAQLDDRAVELWDRGIDEQRCAGKFSAPGPSWSRIGSKLGTPMISIRFMSRSA